MNTFQILTQARDLIAVHFTTGKFHDSGYTCFCSVGAINQVSIGNADAAREGKSNAPYRRGDPRGRALFFLANAIVGHTDVGVGDIYDANDDYGQEYMLKAFDRAISNAKRRHPATAPLEP